LLLPVFSVDLNAAFGDPCPGVSKILRISYVTRGFTGALRVREKEDLLVAAVELGYTLTPPADT
jgi:hypothetical protein